MKYSFFPSMVALSSACVLAVFGVVRNSISLGTTELSGGTADIALIDPDALPPTGPGDAAGEVCNKTGKPMSDLTLDIDGGTCGTITANGLSAQPDERGAAPFTFSPPIKVGACIEIEFTGISADDPDEDVELKGTPSFSGLVDGVMYEFNMLPAFDLQSARDQVRTTLEQAYHAGVYARVVNTDATDRITRIDGRLFFPGPAWSTLTDVELQDINGTSRSAVLSIAGNSFSLTGFKPVPAGGEVWLALRFDRELEGAPARLQLTGKFAR